MNFIESETASLRRAARLVPMEAPDQLTIQISFNFALLAGWQNITDMPLAGRYQNRFLSVL